MITRSRSRYRRAVGMVQYLALVVAGLALAACASANKAALKQVSAESSRSFAAGDYGKALELHKKLYEKDRANGKVVSGYAAMLEDVKSAGDDARSKGSCEAAQSAYCVLAAGWDGYSALAPRLSFKRADLEDGLKDCRLAASERQFRQEIGAGNYAKAVGAYQAVLKDYPVDAAVKTRYANGVTEIKEIAAKALAAKEFALAGRIDGLLLKNLESFEGLAMADGGAGLSREELEDAIRQCTAAMTLDGLGEYRKGNLENAIAIWEELLSFDPANPEVRKAVETARAQMAKLKSASRGGRKGGRGGRGADAR